MELRTILELQASLLLFLGAVVLLAHQTSRAEQGDAAARWFFASSACGAVGLLLQRQQGHWTPWLSVIGGNVLFALLGVMLHQAVAVAVQAKRHWIPYLLAVVAVTAGMLWFYTFHEWDVTRRVFVAAIAMPLLLAPTLPMLLRPQNRAIAVATRTMAGIFIVFIGGCALVVVSILEGAKMRSAANWSGAVMIAGVALCFLWMDLLRLKAELMRQAMTDALTGLANRRAMETQGDREVARAAREMTAVTLLTLDIDRFKSINDRFGHSIGDAALVAVAETLKRNLRLEDIAARMGGDEFAVLLTRSSEEIARQIVERIGAEVTALRLRAHDGGTFPISVTVGRYTVVPSAAKTYADLVHASDMDLYVRKRLKADTVHAG